MAHWAAPIKILLLNIFTTRPVVQRPVTVIGVVVKVRPEVGLDIVAAVFGGGLGIVPCKPVDPD